jgi:hypothetical protein
MASPALDRGTPMLDTPAPRLGAATPALDRVSEPALSAGEP